MEESVRDWYKGKVILITGGTGFMGKVLIEKLLRCCDDLHKIYLLSRPKKNLTSHERLTKLINVPVFQKLLNEKPKAFDKVEMINGDISEENLGLSPGDSKKLKDEVVLVFHLGASVKLEADIKSAVNINTEGTLNMLELAKTMKKLEVFAHISTCFSHCELQVLEERMYETPYPPREIIRSLKWMTEEQSEALSPLLCKNFPNSYTFSKRLGEGLVLEFSQYFPITVLRPSIVLPAAYEPIPGWVDNFNGPIGLLAAAGKGVARSVLGDPDNKVEAIPVDMCCNAFILAAWKRGQTKFEKRDVLVYNISSAKMIPCTWGDILEIGRKAIEVHPFEIALWYPGGAMHNNPLAHYFSVFFFQLLPAYFLDFIFILLGRKPFLVKVQRRLWQGLKVFTYFTTRAWDFETDKAMSLIKSLNKSEKEIFYLLTGNEDVDQYMLDSTLSSRVYLFKEPMSSLPMARRRYKMLYILDKTTKVVFAIIATWVTYIIIIFLWNTISRSIL